LLSPLPRGHARSLKGLAAMAQAPTNSVAVAERRAVVARNFPVAWVAPAALSGLPQKVQQLLQRIGQLEAAPTVTQGAQGLEVIAIFQNTTSARDAVQTLHRFDLRSEAEKKAVNYEAPSESERFYVQVVEPPPAPAAAPTPSPAPSAAGTSASAPSKAAAEAPQPAKLRLKSNGVRVWPLPAGWAENDVRMIAAPYGQVIRIQMEHLSSNQKGALIDYNQDAHAKAALTGLNGLSLMGTQLHCAMQEEPEPVKPILSFVIYIDELSMPSRPEVEARLDDREVFLELPRNALTEDSAKGWLASLGFNAGVEEVVLMKDIKDTPTGKAYVRLKSHPEALKVLSAVQKTASNGSSSQQAAWSESEKVIQGTRGAYGLNMLRRLCGEKNSRLEEICQAEGLTSLTVAGCDGKPSDGNSSGQHQVHFVARCEEQAQADKCKAILSAELAKLHELYTKEVRGSLVLSGFAASWSEKGVKFVFAPFGGITGAVLEEASQLPGDTKPPERLAYVKLKNKLAIDKALSNLHKTKVGDGEIVEESVVACHRWHLQAWSDTTSRATFFIDQLAMNRRPLEAAPSEEDRELFVKNLPLQDMNRQQLQEYFEGYGEVEDLHLITDNYTGEPNGEGYVRFKLHENALRCVEALTPENEAEEGNHLTGWWSESERALQRKSNCYRFNLIAELVGKDGIALDKLKSEAQIKGMWLLAESLQQKDRHAPPRSARQLHFVARCTEDVQATNFRELLERSLEEAHGRISDRIEKRKRKADADEAVSNKENAAEKVGVKPAEVAAGAAAGVPPGGQAPWAGAAPGGWPPGGYWGPGGMPPGGAQPPWFAGQAPPPGYPGYPAPPAPPGVSVFEQGARKPEEASKDKEGRHGEPDDRKRRSRSRKRRHRGERGEAAGGAEGEEVKEKKHRSGGEHKRRRHRRGGSGSPGKGEAEA